jgi:photosystem II stability/assembly factor-like uncharacterized protein
MSYGEGQIRSQNRRHRNHKGEYKRSSMKSKISKILGVGLVLAVLVSLLVVATPASAGYNAWSVSTAPGLTPFKIQGNDILDVAAASNGTTGYAVSSENNTVYKTLDGGLTWAKTSFNGGQAQKVVIAPDSTDGSFLVVVADNNEAWVSSSAGAIFSPMSGFGSTTINSVAISPTFNGAHSVAIAQGNSVWLYSPGAYGAGSTWTDIVAAYPSSVQAGPMLGVQFSPNFSQDRALVVVSNNTTSTLLNIFYTTTSKWNSDYAPYQIASGGTILCSGAASMADIALPNTFQAYDPTARASYYALGSLGLWRWNGISTQLSATQMKSVAINAAGDKLAAGQLTAVAPLSTNNVYTLASPATAVPAATPPVPALKSPSVAATDMVSVAFFGTSIGAATQGHGTYDESSFALSTDGGVSFNDVAFVDTVPAVQDFMVNSDGSKFYMLTVNGSITSLWRKATDWQRVYKASGTDYLIRPVLGNFDAIFLVQKGSGNIMYSNDAGQSSWTPRGYGNPVADFAAESVSIQYVLTPSGSLAITTDSYNYGAPSLTTVGSGGRLNLLSAGNLIISGTSGIAYTTDSGVTWVTPTTNPAFGLGGTGAVDAVADKLATGGVITVINSSTAVQQYIIGVTTAFFPAATAPLVPNDVVISNGQVYVMTTSTLLRSSAYGGVTWSQTTTSTPTTTVTSMGIKAASGNLYTVNGGDNFIYSLTDIFAGASPALTAPANGYIDPINSQTGFANNVVFQWAPITNSDPVGTTYNLQISLDSAFTQVVYGGPGFTAISGTLAILGANQPTTATGYFPFQSDTTYYWRVRTVSVYDSQYSKGQNFKIETLSPIDLISPSTGTSGVSISPTFAWSEAQGATGYVIEVADSSNFAIITYSHTTTDAVYASTEELDYSTVYYWRVRPTGTAYPTASTPFVTGIFTTAAKPTTPVTAPPITITNTTSTFTVQVPPTTNVIPTYLLWIIIGIGAILVITLIVLIVRTRRVG